MAVVGVHEELALELEVLDDLFEGFPGHVRVHLVLLAKLLEFFVEFFLRDGPSLVNGQHHPNVQSVSVITNFFQKILYKYSKKYFMSEKKLFWIQKNYFFGNFCVASSGDCLPDVFVLVFEIKLICGKKFRSFLGHQRDLRLKEIV